MPIRFKINIGTSEGIATAAYIKLNILEVDLNGGAPVLNLRCYQSEADFLADPGNTVDIKRIPVRFALPNLTITQINSSNDLKAMIENRILNRINNRYGADAAEIIPDTTP